MRFRFMEVVTVAAGVLLFDYLFCGKLAPKLFAAQGLAPQQASGCSCGGGCDSCSKNVTDRAQVIDVTPLSAKVPAS